MSDAGPARARGLFTAEECAQLIALRRDLHANPELSWKETRTARVLTDALHALGAADIAAVAGTGVVGRIRGTNPSGPRVALRGDIDALPIPEQTGLPFASTASGVMHACGHDVHATWTIAAAMLLARRPAGGDVMIVLQPAEEVGAGASAVLASGALDGVSCIFGGHVDRRFATGEVIAEPGSLAASADSFAIVLVGRGAHGARPHEGADPIVAAAAVVTALQTIVARRLDPSVPAVVTVGTLHAGSAPNVIPERAELTGTLRAMDAVTRQRLLDEVRHVAESVAAAHSVRAEVRLERGTPPVVNHPGPAALAARAAANVLGPAAVVPFGITNMGGEDFAFYLEKMPGCFLRFGAREAGSEHIPAHSSRFYADEEVIFVGGAVLAECARVASA